MKSSHTHTASRIWTLFLCFIALVFDAQAEEPQDPTVDHSDDPSTVILAYSQHHPLVAETDTTPLLQIYGNGRVHVHYPAYMKRAGDYELYLTPAELNRLLVSMAKKGVMDFDPGTMKRKRGQAELQRRSREGTVFEISDATETRIEVNISDYRRGANAARIPNLRKRMSWKNLRSDAKRYPGVKALKDLAAADEELRELLTRNDLWQLR